MKETTGYDVSSPEYYGFGVGIMKQIKVCGKCGASEPSERYTCSRCGALLPMQTLYQRYQKMHRQCPVCDTVIARGMKFCPHCGIRLTGEQGARDAAQDKIRRPFEQGGTY